MRKPWYRRWWLWIPVGVLVFLVAVALSFDAIVEWRTRKALDTLEGYEATFEDVKLRPFRLTYALTNLKVVKASAGGEKEPFVQVGSLEVGIYWKELIRGHLVTRVDVDGGKLNLIAAKSKSEQQLEPEEPNLSEKLDALLPLKVDRVQIRKSEVIFVDKTEKEFPKLWLHGIEATLENFATRAALARGEPTLVAASGTLQETGQVSLYLTTDPLAKDLSFSGSAQVEGLEMKEFYGIIASKSGLHLQSGTLDLFMQFDARGGRIWGGVKPILKNPKVTQGKSGPLNLFKAVLADAALSLFSDRIEGRDAVATVIPFEGKIAQPQAQLWPTLFGVIRNAFVAGVAESFERLPPPTAKKNENVFIQARRAISPNSGPPKAQPGADEKKANP